MKGQAALEYLMTYGWAILIVIIVGVALYAMGVFNPGSFTGKKYTGLSAFTVLDWKATATQFNVSLSPRGHPMTINTTTGIKMAYGGSSLTTVQCTLTPSTSTVSPSNKYVLSCPVPSGFPTTGSYTGLQLSITYKDTMTGMTHTSTGTFSGKVE